MKNILRILIVFCAALILSACNSVFNGTQNGLGNPGNPPVHHFYTRNIWDAMSSDFSLPSETPENPAVREKINWYISNQAYLKEIAKQAQPYLYYIYQQVKKRHLPAELALLPMVESNYDPFAYSKVGASGLWQMMPGTASGFGIKVDWWYDGRRDIIASTNAALDYLSYLGNFFHGEWLQAIAAYDTGEGTVMQAIERNAKAGKSTRFWDLPLPQETKRYVPKLLALATIIKYQSEYDVQLPNIPNQPYLASVNVDSQIDLSRAAQMANMSLEKLAQLNPGFNRWATDPDLPTYLLLPIDKAAEFQRKLADTPTKERVTWIRHTVKSGDNLITIAKKYQTKPQLIKSVNKLKNNRLSIGQTLLIPIATSHLTHIVLNSEQHYFSSLHRKLPEIHLTNYVVQSGDTLDHIAKRFHVTVRDIRFWNGVKANQYIPVGKILIIWPPKSFYAKPRALYTTYRVKPGDSLIEIAKAYHTSTSTIKQINKIKNNMIRVGQKLKMPILAHYSYTLHRQVMKKTAQTTHPKKRTVYHVKRGDTLSSIAKKFNVTTSNIAHWNNLQHPEALQLNQVLVLYV